MNLRLTEWEQVDLSKGWEQVDLSKGWEQVDLSKGLALLAADGVGHH